ncbi:GNAT family N-acetyltransferase, partial [Bacillus sp. JJ1764]|uniref:GNAT family N-acetyltransferase n=1 Tax=Bacillus sp. JJ1764 TaxID=3122964 RepID=UPI002FFF2202
MEMEEIYGDLPVLETERLILRKITQNDLMDMYSYASNPQVTRFVTWDTHQSLADTQTFIDYVFHHYENQKIAPWGIEYKGTSRLIGTIDFVTWNQHHKTAEIGYVIHPNFWGKGITTEAAKKLIQFGFV